MTESESKTVTVLFLKYGSLDDILDDVAGLKKNEVDAVLAYINGLNMPNFNNVEIVEDDQFGPYLTVDYEFDDGEQGES